MTWHVTYLLAVSQQNILQRLAQCRVCTRQQGIYAGCLQAPVIIHDPDANLEVHGNIMLYLVSPQHLCRKQYKYRTWVLWPIIWIQVLHIQLNISRFRFIEWLYILQQLLMNCFHPFSFLGALWQASFSGTQSTLCFIAFVKNCIGCDGIQYTLYY